MHTLMDAIRIDKSPVLARVAKSLTQHIGTMGKLGLKYITSRADFFKLLAETREETERRISEEPGWKVMDEFLRQLIFMQNCTANGRKPTSGERKSTTMGRSAYHAFQNVTDEGWSDYGEKISDLNSYFKFWLSDKGLSAIDSEDYRTSFPDDYDFSDEPSTPAGKSPAKKR